jgi:hypothetical protein
MEYTVSNIQYAFVEQGLVPGRSQLQEAIDALGFDIKLHPECTPFEDSGFLPFALNGEEGPGFDIQFVPSSEPTSDDEVLERYAGGRDFCISMTWHGSMKDLACVLLVRCALAKDFGAVVCYEGEPPESLDRMLAVVPEVLADADAQAVRDADRAVQQKPKKPWWRPL